MGAGGFFGPLRRGAGSDLVVNIPPLHCLKNSGYPRAGPMREKKENEMKKIFLLLSALPASCSAVVVVLHLQQGWCTQ